MKIAISSEFNAGVEKDALIKFIEKNNLGDVTDFDKSKCFYVL